jgi:hypothetical protein
MNQGGAMWRLGFFSLTFPKSSFRDPNRWRGDLIGGAAAGVFASRAFEARPTGDQRQVGQFIAAGFMLTGEDAV